jgi:hypothetical protein
VVFGSITAFPMAKRGALRNTDGEGKAIFHPTKHQLGISAKGRKVIDSQGISELRESAAVYLINFAPGNSDIDVINAYFWNAVAIMSLTSMKPITKTKPRRKLSG